MSFYTVKHNEGNIFCACIECHNKNQKNFTHELICTCGKKDCSISFPLCNEKQRLNSWSDHIDSLSSSSKRPGYGYPCDLCGSRYCDSDCMI